MTAFCFYFSCCRDCSGQQEKYSCALLAHERRGELSWPSSAAGSEDRGERGPAVRAARPRRGRGSVRRDGRRRRALPGTRDAAPGRGTHPPQSRAAPGAMFPLWKAVLSESVLGRWPRCRDWGRGAAAEGSGAQPGPAGQGSPGRDRGAHLRAGVSPMSSSPLGRVNSALIWALFFGFFFSSSFGLLFVSWISQNLLLLRAKGLCRCCGGGAVLSCPAQGRVPRVVGRPGTCSVLGSVHLLQRLETHSTVPLCQEKLSPGENSAPIC